MKLKIAWLYPRLMSTYGDRGNVLTLVKRCQWRNISVEVLEADQNVNHHELTDCRLVFMGGAQDRQQKMAADDLLSAKGPIIGEMVERGVPALFVCAAYQFLGHYYKAADGTEIPGLGLFDLHTVNPGPNVTRCIGNIVVEILSDSLGLPATGYQLPTTLVGFENHGGRTYLGEKVRPLGKVIRGFGNNGEDKTEGAVYRNAVGCYFHGPCLPRNPHLADYLIAKALEIDIGELSPLDDALELKAHVRALK